jgi:hypothetical protein
VIESDEFGQALTEFIHARGTWEGTAAELLAGIEWKNRSRSGVTSASVIGYRLKHLAPVLTATGIKVDQWREKNPSRRRLIRLETSDQ